MIVPDVNFHGMCREAMTFYHGLLAGTLEMMGFADRLGAPPEMAASGRVMHASFESPHGKLLASDDPPGLAGATRQAVTVSLLLDDGAKAQRVFAALAVGEAVTQPFEPSFFSSGFGILTDSFGTSWMVLTNR
jgi:PhnB protein